MRVKQAMSTLNYLSSMVFSIHLFDNIDNESIITNNKCSSIYSHVLFPHELFQAPNAIVFSHCFIDICNKSKRPHIVRPFDAVGCVLEVSEALERKNDDAEVRWES